ncbi:MAG: hypothetical protein MK041_02970 [Aquabacterium sp.]|nr:hypothetical protein [Aquabacterium sp.]
MHALNGLANANVHREIRAIGAAPDEFVLSDDIMDHGLRPNVLVQRLSIVRWNAAFGLRWYIQM